MRSLDIAERYQSWATQSDAPGMSIKQVREAMTNIGHGHFRSNQTYFGDVQLATAEPDLADNFPSVPAPSETLSLLSSIDRIQTELIALRRALGHQAAPVGDPKRRNSPKMGCQAGC